MGKIHGLELVVDFEVPDLDVYRIDGEPFLAEELIRVGDKNHLGRVQLTEDAPSRRGLAMFAGSMNPKDFNAGDKLYLGLPKDDRGHVVVVSVLE